MSLPAILAELNPWWGDAAARIVPVPPVRRDLHAALLRRLLDPGERRAAVVFGPRQVGKTVLLWQLADDLLRAGAPPRAVIYFDFSDDRLVGAPLPPRAVVEAAQADLPAGQPPVFLFDEVEHSAGWDRFLKSAVDRGQARFVVTSSAASHLRAAARESGPGRWDEERMEGLTFREFLRILDGGTDASQEALARRPAALPAYVALGGFPEHVTAAPQTGETRRRLRQDIAERAILRDLLRTGVDVTRVRDLFVYLVQSSGAIFDAAPRARDLDADPRTVRDWLRLLEETCLVVALEPFALRAAARLRKRTRPKVYAADHGLVSAFLPGALPHDDPGVRGALMETMVFRHLRTLPAAALRYYRSERGAHEIDFVVDGPDGRIAVEVTAAQSPRPEKLARLNAAAEDAGIRRRALVHGGMAEGTGDGVRLLPLHRFLLDPAGSLAEAFA